MTIKLFDTAQRKVVAFEPAERVSMYVCGITPYDSTHLGHAATYLSYDLLVRRLEELGHDVRLVRNVTDVDDSILPKARELGVPYLELAASELARFQSDMAALDMRPPSAEPRATEAIDGMIDLINTLLDKGSRVPHARHGVLRHLHLPEVRRALALLA
jgi:L-cysteine:1D-myo-inositol 2-amino-2-deoxy-alpha-D-glucopyranoside ligase